MPFLLTRLSAAFLISALCAHNSFATTAIDDFQYNRLEKAKSKFQTQLDNPKQRKQAHYYLAKIHLSQAQHPLALEHIEKAIAIKSAKADEYLVQGEIYGAKAQAASIFKKLKYAKLCLQYLEKAHTLAPQNIDALNALIDYHQFAPSIAKGSKDKRDQYIEELRTLAPDLAKVKKIQALHLQKENEQAQREAQLLYRENITNIDAHYALAKFFKETQDYTKAAKLFTQLAEKNNDDSLVRRHRWLAIDANLQLAETYLADASQLEKGIALIKHYQSLNADPNDPHYYWAFWSLAKLYKANNKLGDYEQVVQKIKTMNYKENKHFAQEFDAATG